MNDIQLREVLVSALLQFDSTLTEATANYVVADLLETMDLNDPEIMRHEWKWIAERFYASYYLHAGWWC